MTEIGKRLQQLKNERNAIILAHTYTYPDVQNNADYVGDSFGLSKQAASVKDAERIVFAGVKFMAETAAMLAPDRTVLLPVISAGCPMADTITAGELRGMKERHPDAAVVCYVNSTAETKAESDVCVTSSNAVKIVNRLSKRKIIFVPDRNLGSYVAEQLPDREVVLWDNGHCYVHSQVTPESVRAARETAPGGVVLMHPECPPEARAEADHILSTGQMAAFVAKRQHDTYIIVTEEGIIHHLRTYDDTARYVPLPHPSMHCSNMKKNSVSDIVTALERDEHVVTVPDHVADRARTSLTRMLELAE